MSVHGRCRQCDECELLELFFAADKAVFTAEYLDSYVGDPGPLCEAALARGLRTLLLSLDLDDAGFAGQGRVPHAMEAEEDFGPSSLARFIAGLVRARSL